MESQLSPGARQQLDRFCRQYLQLQLRPEYPDDEHLRNGAFQQCVYVRLLEENAIKHAPPQRYQFRVLKELVKKIEQSIQDSEEEGVSDDIMNSFSSLLFSAVPSEVTSAQQKSYVTYVLSSLHTEDEVVPSITLLEARNLLAVAGITGLRTWEASFHLGNYLCANSGHVEGKSILELGAGTGYISVLCAKLKAAHVLATDGSDDVVASLSTNFYLNGLQDASTIEGKELKWGEALVGSEHPEWNAGRKIDLILGADLTYDGSWHLALLSTLDDLLDLYSEAKIIIAATVRNQKTFEVFLERCSKANFAVEQIGFGIKPAALQEGPFYDDQEDPLLSPSAPEQSLHQRDIEFATLNHVIRVLNESCRPHGRMTRHEANCQRSGTSKSVHMRGKKHRKW